MRAALAFAALLLFALDASRAEDAAILDGGVTFSIPAGYSRLSPSEMSVKFSRTNRPPLAAFADLDRNATIAFTLSKQRNPFSEAQLPEFLNAMEQMFPRMMPGLVWHKREVISIAGRRWARLHLSAHALDTDVTNDMYFTPFRGDILGVNLNATSGRWRAAQPALVEAFRTLKIREFAP
jgi:hypothetical protein